MTNDNLDVKRKNSKNKLSDIKELEIIGIEVISSIVTKARIVADPSVILSAIKEILFFYRLIPRGVKKKAYKIFEKLWNKAEVLFSTDPEQPENFYEASFGSGKLGKLYKSVSPTDQAIMIQGKSMLSLIEKSLHSSSDEIKKSVKKRYGLRGLNIVDIITTKDIEYLLDEIKEPITAKNCVMIFNDWVSNYSDISLLISPLDLDAPKEIQRKIIKISENTKRNYVVLNISSGTDGDCNKLLKIVLRLRKEKKLMYEKEEHNIYPSGFRTSMKIRLFFKSVNEKT